MKQQDNFKKVTDLFEFLKQYYAVKNPPIKSITNQIWHQEIKELPQNIEVKSYLEKPLEDGLILKVGKPLEADKKAEEIFNSFYTLYARMKKEAEAVELVYGKKYLIYDEINHPIFLQQLTLEFDATIPEFRVYIANKEPEIYRGVLNQIEEVDEEGVIDCLKEFTNNPINLFDQAELDRFTEKIKYALDSEGKKQINIEDLSTIFLRKRNMGINDVIETIKQDIEESKEVPSFIWDIVGEQPPQDNKSKQTTFKSTLKSKSIDHKILLTKPVNNEQLLIAKQLQKNDAVLVQGPPGTGKTHTIANILGNALAEGKNVLVTSYSEKALTVVKEQVVEELQPLCLSVLSSSKSREELEDTLATIHDKRSTLDKAELINRINANEKNRELCLHTLERLNTDIKSIRRNNQAPIKVAGKMYKPVEAAKYVYENKDKVDDIEGPVRGGAALPLTVEEVKELYRLNEQISQEQEKIVECSLPTEEELLKPQELESFVKLAKKTTSQTDKESYKYIKNTSKNNDIEQLKDVIGEFNCVIGQIEPEHTWCLETLEAGKEEKSKEKWLTLVSSVKELYQLSQTYADEIMSYNPEVLELNPKIKALDVYSQISERLEKTGKLTKIVQLLNPSIKTVIEASRVNGKMPESLKDFEVLIHHMVLEEKREQLKIRWNRQMGSLGAKRVEQLGDQFEEGCQKYVQVILENLEWYKQKWEPLVVKLEANGIDIEALLAKQSFTTNKYQELKYIKEQVAKRVNDALQYKIYKAKKEIIEQQKMLIDAAITGYKNATDSEVLEGMKEAIYKENVEKYERYYLEVIQAQNLKPIIEERNMYLQKIEYVAPLWAKAIINKESSLPEDIEGAWICKQFAAVFAKREERKIDDVKQEIKNIESRLKEYTIQLATDRAWLHKVVEFEKNKEQVQAIESWKQLILKIGAGKGKQAESLKKEAKQLMPKCQSAVPAWIMPLNKVIENFDARKNKFDLVIIDEASQSDLLALVALYLGKQVLIVGDDEQVSPLAVGERIEMVERLTKEYLEDIPNRYLYSGKFSIYDLAAVSGYQPVKLKEHFRCASKIIEYSNKLSYKGEIRSLRNDKKIAIQPSVQTIHIDKAKEEDGVNEKEAKAIINQIIKCIKDPRYKGKTIGVISLKGDKQATFIETALQAKIDPKIYEQRKILCGNPSHFQGDERDIIFISLVDSCNKEETMRLMSYGADNLYKKRYNVAMSRAKDQVWVVHSFDPVSSLKDGDIRKELIDYCNQTTNGAEIAQDNELIGFKESVKKQFKEKGVMVEANKKIGNYNIDLMIEQDSNNIGIVLDDLELKDAIQFEKEIESQKILERVGWQIVNISEADFWNRNSEIIDEICQKFK